MQAQLSCMNWYKRARRLPSLIRIILKRRRALDRKIWWRSLLALPIVGQGFQSRVASDWNPQKHGKRHHSLLLIGTELGPTSSIPTDDETWKRMMKTLHVEQQATNYTSNSSESSNPSRTPTHTSLHPPNALPTHQACIPRSVSMESTPDLLDLPILTAGTA